MKKNAKLAISSYHVLFINETDALFGQNDEQVELKVDKCDKREVDNGLNIDLCCPLLTIDTDPVISNTW